MTCRSSLQVLKAHNCNLSSFPSTIRRIILIFSYEKRQLETLDLYDTFSGTDQRVMNAYDAIKHIGSAKTFTLVQWNKYPTKVQEDPSFHSKPLQQRMVFHSYEDLNIMNGYGEYLEAKRQEELTQKLRTTKVKMNVMQPNPRDNDNFIVFVEIQVFQEFEKLLAKASSVVICDEPPPKQKAKLKQGEKPKRDDQPGWVAYLKTDEYILQSDSRANIVACTSRPKNEKNPALTKDMMNQNEEQDQGGRCLRYKNSKGKPDAERIHELFVSPTRSSTFNRVPRGPLPREPPEYFFGRNLTAVKPADLFEGMSDGDLKNFVKGQTPSQTDFLAGYCRRLTHGFGLFIGPFGSGKTSTIKTISQACKQIGKRVLVVATQNAAADRVVMKVTEDKSLQFLRLHGLGLEKITMTKDARKDVPSGALLIPDPEPLQPDEDEAEGEAPKKAFDPKAMIAATGSISDDSDDDRDQVKSPNDPRMVLIEHALWTKILRYTGILPNETVTNPTTWSEFRSHYEKSRKQILNQAGKRKYNTLVRAIAERVIKDSDGTVCTIAQLGSDLMQKQHFNVAIIDEASVPTMFECFQVVSQAKNTVMIGDSNQLGPTILSAREFNVFKAVLEYSSFKRLIDSGYPHFMLKESMRMIAGLKDIANDLFYEGKLLDGPGTSLAERPKTFAWLELIHTTYPSLREAPKGLAYPLLLNAWTSSLPEPGEGTSRWNPQNVACAIQYIRLLTSGNVFQHSEIGVITPYSAQVEAYVSVLRTLGMADVQVRTVEGWMGHEKRLKSLHFNTGLSPGDYWTQNWFILTWLVETLRLCVLLTRQLDALTIIGDQYSTRPYEEDKKDGPVDKAVQDMWAKKNKTNQHLKQLYEWMSKHGHAVDTQEFDEDVLSLLRPPIEETVEVAAAENNAGPWDAEEGQAGKW
ncbi:MAG: hypothetical protein Q9181_002795 [Wetmoreana brouardii]